MLRMLLGQPPRAELGMMQGAADVMKRVRLQIEQREKKGNDPEHTYRKYEIWTQGLVVSLDELEQSVFASGFFADKVKQAYQSEMSKQEEADYHRHIYFYKNGFIRVFSILDKLGTLMNALFDLHTERAKAHFSFFTVLRQFRYLSVHMALMDKLNGIKEQYKEPLNSLRKMRNIEIHYMNMEMQDDLWQRDQTLNGKVKLEDIQQKQKDLELGYQMACETLQAAFEYIEVILRNKYHK
ncbi:hypothetical protein BVG16_04470 [Paenibacillus selenitireducens]|uniref:Cthe-2314-like HEPN domain-containing protein n=1 Tax=Paenibacillus selenitireducens TaxID=1324314 RepID=A0A1T2XJL8_9BACL|nr:Cthe_2314 family HEPN domain-containing protein [Paenibacillus selenitireducens]OPA80012.1 hypothetical protein BVG16_04470 [Paenibacillus selenitireducens]